ncbi:hypothetical protein L3V82_04560 [Thiotrichales bacterium 19S3-7]|nr:hypothetical protein [Thiotrichales bacterium 19S3-7]MCF6801368.1 hypothetical protein [Thiotrichales bacterium 19S3-11]
MPKYHHSFYFSQEQSTQAFKDSPPGNISFNRLVQGKRNYWVDPYSEMTKAKKTLILTDSLAYLAKDINKLKLKLAQLVDDGFNLYIWHENAMKLLNLEMINRIDQQFLEGISFVDNDDVVNHAFKYKKIPKDQLHILDSVECQRLLEDNYQISNYPLYSSALLDSSIVSDYSPKKYIVINDHKSTKLQLLKAKIAALHSAVIIIDDTLLSRPVLADILSDVIEAIPDQQPKKTAIIVAEDIDLQQLLEQDLSEVTTIDLRDCPNITDEQLDQLLAATNNLKQLKLSNCSQLNLNLEQYAKLAKLTLLNLDKMNVNEAYLSELLKSAVNLENLHLNLNSKLTNELDESIHLENLQHFSVASESMTIENIELILWHSQALKTLDLKDFEGFSNEFYLNANLSLLESIKIAGDISLEELQKLLLSAANLEAISLVNCDNLEGEFTQAISLNKLKKLELNTSELTPTTFLELISTARSLEKLTEYYSIETKIAKAFDMDFRELKHIDVEESQLSDEDMYHLLKNAPNVEYLNFSLTEITFKGFELLNLNKLVTLKAESLDEICLESLAGMLNNAQALKSIDLSEVTFIRDELIELSSILTNDRYLENLEELNLSGTNITDEELSVLLKNAKNLKVLDIRNCENITGIFYQGLDLSSLEYLHITEESEAIFGEKNYLLEENILAIIDRAPNLDNASEVLDKFYRSLSNAQKKLNKASKKVSQIEVEVSPNLVNHSSTSMGSVDFVEQYIESTDSYDSYEELDELEAYPKEIEEESNLEYDEESLHAKQIFVAINGANPGYGVYRRAIYSQLSVTEEACTLEKAFKLKQTEDLALLPLDRCNRDITYCSVKKSFDYLVKKAFQSGKDNYYFAKQKMHLTNEFVPIASLSHHELITQMYIDGADQRNIEINYSASDNLYYIRALDDSVTVELNYLLETYPQQHQSVDVLPIKLQEYYKALSSFDSKPIGRKLDLGNLDSPTGYDYLSLMYEQELAGCAHRSILLKAFIDKKFPLMNARIVHNDVHAFVEVEYQDQWIKLDLGGYESEIKADKSAFDDSEFEVEKIDSESNLGSPNLLFIEPMQMQKYQKLQQNASKYFIHKSSQKSTLDTFVLIQGILSDDQSKHLVEFDEESELAFYNQISHYAQHTSKDIIYIHSAEDLSLLIPTVKHNINNTGVIQQPPGGALYDYLTQDHKHPPIIVINYSNFSAAEIVRFNSILDDLKKIDGIEIPQNTKIIGIRNQNDPNVYQGADFLSRFDQRHHVSEVAPIASPIRDLEQDEIVDGPIIDLFHAQDWKEILLGRWIINGDELYYQDGLLKEALTHGNSLILKNIPKSKEFEEFFSLAKIHGKICHNGIEIKLPKEFKVIDAQEGYDFEELKDNVVALDNQFNANAITLNPTLLSQFFNRYRIDNLDKKLTMADGYLKAYQDGTLEVNLTRNLTDDQWARLLTECKHLNIKVVIHTNEAVELPFDVEINKVKKAAFLLENISAIQTNDPDVTVSSILDEHDSIAFDVIHVTDLTTSDLLKKINGNLNDVTLKFEFNETEHYLINAIQQNKNILLYGEFNNEFSDALIDFLNAQDQYTGKLYLVSPDMSAFSSVAVNEEVVQPQAKLALLEKKGYDEKYFGSLNDFIEIESFAQLETRVKYLQLSDSDNSDHAWHGLDALSSEIVFDEFDLEHAQEMAELFQQQRILKLTNQLAHSPYVFITGLTGVGKTTTVCKFFQDNEAYHFYQNQSSIKLWAKDTSDKQKILFLDEANLTHTNWSEFEGLFNTPPSIFIDGELIELTAKHKVIFAGNPLSYGDERTLAPLFKRHGSAVEFSPMSLEFIYDRILKPVFKGSDFEGDEAKLLLPILDVYQYLCSLSKDEVLISPRELQMMALLTLNASITDPINCVNYAKFYSYSLGRNSVPEDKLLEFEEKFSAVRPVKIELLDLKERDHSFVVTESRKPIQQLLNDSLALRALKQAQPYLSQYSGLGGMILEGEPGVGKSDIVIKTMLSNGLKEGKDFYLLPISMPLEEKKRLLLKAFDEGAIVVVDEINSAPMLEELLNALLMGKNLQGHIAEKPGFMVIGTQNPASFSGRKQASQALERRLIKVELPVYTVQEMLQILVEKGLEIGEAKVIIDAFELEKKKNPKLTFRDLNKYVKCLLRARYEEALIIELQEAVSMTALTKALNKVKPYAKALAYRVVVESLNTIDEFLELIASEELDQSKKAELFKVFENKLPEIELPSMKVVMLFSLIDDEMQKFRLLNQLSDRLPMIFGRCDKSIEFIFLLNRLDDNNKLKLIDSMGNQLSELYLNATLFKLLSGLSSGVQVAILSQIKDDLVYQIGNRAINLETLLACCREDIRPIICNWALENQFSTLKEQLLVSLNHQDPKDTKIAHIEDCYNLQQLLQVVCWQSESSHVTKEMKLVNSLLKNNSHAYFLLIGQITEDGTTSSLKYRAMRYYAVEGNLDGFDPNNKSQMTQYETLCQSKAVIKNDVNFSSPAPFMFINTNQQANNHFDSGLIS